MGRRIRWLGLILIVCFTLVLLQLVNIQVRQASSLNAAKTNPRNLAKQQDNHRGIIRAATGAVLARSIKIAHSEPGAAEYYRTYPTGTLFSGVVGYSSAYYGTRGVEYEYNTQLLPHKQTATTLGQLLNPPAPAPDDVVLTVQRTLQQLVKTALAGLPGPNKDAAAVVIQPRTGAVLAMYSSPSFDPNALADPDPTKDKTAGEADQVKDAEGFEPLQPLATWYPELPGSTFKVVTSTAAYHLKPTLATFTFPMVTCTDTAIKLPTNLNICNDTSTHGGATGKACGGKMTQMLPTSCDPGYATLGYKEGPTVLSAQAEDFGFNSRPPIDLTTSTVETSKFPSVDSLQPGAKTGPGPGGVPLAAFGQGTVSATALQDAMVAAGIANTGTVMTPHVMAQIRSSQGGLVQTYKPKAYKQAATAASAKRVNTLMQEVVTTPHGTAHGVGFAPDDHVAVKTGTAQVGYPHVTTVNDWMIGFAPATNPTVAVAVLVPHQPRTTTGAGIAGPVFKEIIEGVLAQQRANGEVTTTTTTSTSTTTTAPLPDQSRSTTTTAPGAPTTTAPSTTTTQPSETTTTTTTAPAGTTTTTTVAAVATAAPTTSAAP
ncbi:MAG TPA: penicillin-binding transpeptidase domain-containing protein [Acidimicrobiales bacterium]|nr:penicillin-binding transpeptidase domain-containing protein [Acidimicrobiales bacterium]